MKLPRGPAASNYRALAALRNEIGYAQFCCPSTIPTHMGSKSVAFCLLFGASLTGQCQDKHAGTGELVCSCRNLDGA
jgi:hypothetical protein